MPYKIFNLEEDSAKFIEYYQKNNDVISREVVTRKAVIWSFQEINLTKYDASLWNEAVMMFDAWLDGVDRKKTDYWHFPKSLDQEKDIILSAWIAENEEGLSKLGWYLSKIEVWYRGPLNVEEIPEERWY